MGEIRFVGTGETRGYPYLVCKKLRYFKSRLDIGASAVTLYDVKLVDVKSSGGIKDLLPFCLYKNDLEKYFMQHVRNGLIIHLTNSLENKICLKLTLHL